MFGVRIKIMWEEQLVDPPICYLKVIYFAVLLAGFYPDSVYIYYYVDALDRSAMDPIVYVPNEN